MQRAFARPKTSATPSTKHHTPDGGHLCVLRHSAFPTSVASAPAVPPGEASSGSRKLVVHPDANRASGAPRCPPHAIAHQPSLTYCFFHSSALIGSSEMPYTASTFTWSVNNDVAVKRGVEVANQSDLRG